MRRLDRVLRIAEEGLFVDRLNGRDTADRVAAIAKQSARYDRLAGVPGADRSDDPDGDAA